MEADKLEGDEVGEEEGEGDPEESESKDISEEQEAIEPERDKLRFCRFFPRREESRGEALCER